MNKGNVLVLGNSGVGKSTLINAILGTEKAKTGWGSSGTTSRLELYEPTKSDIPFRLIDTIGFEPGFIKQQRAIHAVEKWSKQSAKKGHKDNQINVIWFCVEGTSSKLFPETIKALTRAASIWKSVPVIVVITKSYSTPEREQNREMVYNAFASQKKHGANLKKVIPVVAKTYQLNDDSFVAPDGISELINATNELLPEGFQAAKSDLSKFILRRNRFLAQSVVAAATVAGVTIGASPIPFSDAALLAPTELGEVRAIAGVYNIGKDEDSKLFLDSIVKVGTVSTAAKAIISALKAIPGVNIAASVINAVTAGVIVAALGEGSIYAFEQVYLGNKSTKDIEWVTKLIEGKLSLKISETIEPIMNKLKDSTDKSDIMKVISEIVSLNKEK